MSGLVPQIAHMAAALVGVPAAFAFDRLSQAEFVGRWALGSMGLAPTGDGVFVGHSLFDGSPAHVEIRPAPKLGLIDFAVGTAEVRSPRISIRITPGPVTGRGESVCIVTLHALRSAQAEEARWAQTCIAHETEILLIKAQLERAYAEGQD